jgi:hypothetical protein
MQNLIHIRRENIIINVHRDLEKGKGMLVGRILV